MSAFEPQWLPYLGDAVAVRAGDQDVTGTTTKYDASLVEVEGGVVGVEVGQSVGAAWRVGSDVHRGPGQVVLVSDTGFSVRLAPAATVTSRRAHERVSLSVPLVVSPTQRGSYGAEPRQGHTLDLSNSGMRALLDAEAGFAIGETVRVELEFGDRVEVLLASVVWDTGHGPGERVAGLRFLDEVEAISWVAQSLAH